MVTKEQKIRLGAFLVISSVLLVIILAMFILPKLREEGTLYYIDFKGISVTGVNEGADVKYQGVKIGKVVRLEVNPNDLNSVLVRVRIKKHFPLKVDMSAKLQYLGITGLKFIEITGGKVESKFIEPGGEIHTQKGLGEKAEDIVINVDSVVAAVNDILNPQNREKISNILANIEKSSHTLASVLDGRKKELDNIIVTFDKTMTQISILSENLTTFSTYLNELKEKALIEKTINNIDKLVGRINERFSKKEFGKIMNDIDKIIGTADSSIRKIESQFQDVGGELKSTLIKLRESVENIARFTRELREDPSLLIRKRPGERSKK